MGERKGGKGPLDWYKDRFGNVTWHNSQEDEIVGKNGETLRRLGKSGSYINAKGGVTDLNSDRTVTEGGTTSFLTTPTPMSPSATLGNDNSLVSSPGVTPASFSAFDTTKDAPYKDPRFAASGFHPKVEMMSSMWDAVGILLANSKPENQYAAGAAVILAIGFSKGKAADDVLKTETRVFRAVNDVELASIHSTGKFFVKNGLTEAKYFAKSLEDAHLFGKQLYPKGYTVVEGIINNSNNPMKYWSPGTDRIGAFIFNQKILQAVKPIINK